MEKNQKQIMIQIMAVYFVMFSALYITMTQRIPFLTSLGYTITQQNLIFSVQAIVLFVIQLVFGYLCDRYKSIKKFALFSVIIGTLGAYLMFNITKVNFFFHILTIAFMGSFLNLFMGLMDSWSLELDPVISENYGAVRAFGSLGWIVGGYIVTLILERFGFGSLSLTFLIFSIIAFLLIMRLQDAVKSSQPVDFRHLKDLVINKRYVLVVIALFFAMMINASDGVIVVMKMEALQATAFEKYLRFAIQAMVELPLLFFGAKLFSRFKAINLLIFSLLMYVLRFVAYGFASSPWMMIGASLLQVVTFPVLLIASKRVVWDESPEHLKSSGQMIAVAIYNGVAGAILPLITAVLIEFGGIDFTFFALTGLLIVPLVILFGLREKPEA